MSNRITHVPPCDIRSGNYRIPVQGAVLLECNSTTSPVTVPFPVEFARQQNRFPMLYEHLVIRVNPRTGVLDKPELLDRVINVLHHTSMEVMLTGNHVGTVLDVIYPMIQERLKAA